MKRILLVALVINMMAGCDKGAEDEYAYNENDVFKREQIIGKWQYIADYAGADGWIGYLYECERGDSTNINFKLNDMAEYTDFCRFGYDEAVQPGSWNFDGKNIINYTVNYKYAQSSIGGSIISGTITETLKIISISNIELIAEVDNIKRKYKRL
jgi:hypothetical protein